MSLFSKILALLCQSERTDYTTHYGNYGDPLIPGHLQNRQPLFPLHAYSAGSTQIFRPSASLFSHFSNLIDFDFFTPPVYTLQLRTAKREAMREKEGGER